jgi:hypothetical protein
VTGDTILVLAAMLMYQIAQAETEEKMIPAEQAQKALASKSSVVSAEKYRVPQTSGVLHAEAIAPISHSNQLMLPHY